MTQAINLAQDADPFDPMAGTLQRLEGSLLENASARAQKLVDTAVRLGDAVNPMVPSAGINTSILALDLGTKTGYAVRRRDGRIIHGMEDFTARASWAPGQKWLRFRSWLSSLIATHQVTHIAFEDVRRHPLGQVLAAHAYGGFRAMLEMVADQHRVTLDTVGVGQIKKHWTGNGTAKKPEMIDQAKIRGFRVTDDNEADGLAILHWALAKEAGTWQPAAPRPKKARVRAPKDQGKLL